MPNKTYTAFSTLDLFDRLRLSTEHPEAPAMIDELERRWIVLRDYVVKAEGDITRAQEAWERAQRMVGA